jgi:integrase
MRSVTLQPPTGLSDEAARITPRQKAGRCSRKSGKASVPHADLTGPHLNISKDAIDRRTINLPAIVVKALRAHRARQLEERLIAGGDWQDTGLVFTTRRGTPLDPRTATKVFHAIRSAATLPPIRFHDLRHTAATLLLAQGVSPRVIMETL